MHKFRFTVQHLQHLQQENGEFFANKYKLFFNSLVIVLHELKKHFYKKIPKKCSGRKLLQKTA